MKKLLSLAALLLSAFAATTFTACSNDDIQVDRAVTVDVKLSTVVAPFSSTLPYEGPVASLDTDRKVRVRLLAYDSNGAKVFDNTQLKDNYQEVARVQLDIPTGEYTLVAITDVVRLEAAGSTNINHNSDAWTVENEEKLTTLTIAKTNINSYRYAILGIGTLHVNLSNAQQYLGIEPKPAGAIVNLNMTNVNAPVDSNIQGYTLQANKYTNYINFNDQGEYVIVPSTTAQAQYVNLAVSSDRTLYQNYFFLLPTSDVELLFWGITGVDTETNRAKGKVLDRKTVTTVASDQYRLNIDCSNPAIDFGKVN